MNSKELAKILDGREIGEEITDAEEKIAKKSGLVVLFGASDDMAEFRGAIHDETYPSGDDPMLVTGTGIIEPHDDCECRYCGYEAVTKSAKTITAIWNDGGYSWKYETKIPHATFDVKEGNEKYCRGIVFAIKDLQA